MQIDPLAIASGLHGPITLDDGLDRESRAVLIHRLATKLIGLRREPLRSYLSLPKVEAFHESRALWRIVDGANQAGKTAAVVMEIGRAVTNSDPHGKYPSTGSVLAIGLDNQHLADPMYHALCESGAFWLIPDEQTGVLRPLMYDPGDPRRLLPYDEAYPERWVPSAPAIPPRLIRRIAWEDSGLRVPKLIELKTGWRIRFRSSEGKPEQGTQRNVYWFDEELRDEQHIIEAMRGMMRFGGVGIWSATPQAANPQLLAFRERAEAGDPDVFAVQLLLEDNPFITAKAKKQFFDSLPEEEREVRYFGQYAVRTRLIYGCRYFPARNPEDGGHGCEPFEVDAHWPIYVGLDPGRARTGTAIGTVDPEERHLWILEAYDLRHSNAGEWAYDLAQRLGGRRPEAVVVDVSMGCQTPVGEGNANVASQYFAAMMRAGVEPARRGPLSGLFPSIKRVEAREEAFLAALSIRRDDPFAGTPKLVVVRGRCAALDKEIHHARLDLRRDKRARQPEDVLEATEFLVGFDPGYVYSAPEVKPTHDPAYRDYLKKKRRAGSGIDW